MTEILFFRNLGGNPFTLDRILSARADKYVCLGDLIGIHSLRMDHDYDGKIKILRDVINGLERKKIACRAENEFKVVTNDIRNKNEELSELEDTAMERIKEVESCFDENAVCLSLYKTQMAQHPEKYKWLRGWSEKTLFDDYKEITQKDEWRYKYDKGYAKAVKEMEPNDIDFLFKRSIRIQTENMVFLPLIGYPRRTPNHEKDKKKVDGAEGLDEWDLTEEQISIFFGQGAYETIQKLMSQSPDMDIYFAGGLRAGVLWEPYSYRGGFANANAVEYRQLPVDVKGRHGILVHPGSAENGFYCKYDTEAGKVTLYQEEDLRSTRQVKKIISPS